MGSKEEKTDAQFNDADFLVEMLGDDDENDEYVPANSATVITKTFEAPEDEDMRTFLKKKDLVVADLEIVEEKTRDVRMITQKLEEVYLETETKEYQKELSEKIKSGDYRSIRARKKLNQLKMSTKELKKSSNKRIKSQIAIRKNIQATLERRFIEVTRDLQEAKGAYQARLRQNITRQVQIADPQATDAEISEAIENGTAHDLIQRSLNRSSLAHQEFQDKADDVAEKSKDILELQQSMEKLKKMFEDLAALIEMQSEQVDAIELTVDEASNNVEEGTKELEGVVHEQKEIRKRITTLLVVLGVCIVGGTIAIVVWQLISP